MSTTTAPNAIAPGAGSMMAKALNCTSATSTAPTKMSTIDQRPIQAVAR